MADIRYLVADNQVVIEGDRTAEHWLFRLMREFSILQDESAHIISTYLSLKSPVLSKKISKNHLSRLSDEERWDYIKALAEDVGYAGDLQIASDAFWRCKRVRDLIAHSTDIRLGWTRDKSFYHYDVPPHLAKKIPIPLTPATVRTLGTECTWLQYFVEYLAYLGGIRMVSSRGRKDGDSPIFLKLLPPPSLPVPADWEPENSLYVELTEEDS